MYRESAYPNEADVSPRCDLQAAAQKVQKCLLNKPRHPAQLAADTVEHVVATGGEPYLDTEAQTLSWWQLSYNCFWQLLSLPFFVSGEGCCGLLLECSYVLVKGC